MSRSLQKILFIMRTTTSGGTEDASVGRRFVTGLVDLFTLWKIAMVFVSLLVEWSLTFSKELEVHRNNATDTVDHKKEPTYFCL